jgi:hypothetical protein
MDKQFFLNYLHSTNKAAWVQMKSQAELTASLCYTDDARVLTESPWIKIPHGRV